MKQLERVLSPTMHGARTQLEWKRYAVDSLLSIGGVTLVTSVISLAHLYPRIPTISFVYLLLVLLLASSRGLYAAILTSLLGFLCFDYFFFPPPYTFIVVKLEDLLTLCVFLVTAIVTGQVASAQRRREQLAKSRELEIRRLYEQAQELAALQERQRLARELHDSVSQALYGISLGAHTAREALPGDPEQAAASLDYVIALTTAGLAEMRALIFELRPESLETEGLVAALLKQILVLRTRYKLAVVEDLGAEPPLSLELKEALYRTAQEALHNIVKHARATNVKIQLVQLENAVLLTIEDDGRGFDPNGSFPGHLGLQSMQERVAKVNGTLTIESTPGQGTTVAIAIPHTQ